MSGLTPNQQDILLKLANMAQNRPQDLEWKGIAVMIMDQGLYVRGPWIGDRPEQKDLDVLVRGGFLTIVLRENETIYIDVTRKGYDLAQEL